MKICWNFILPIISVFGLLSCSNTAGETIVFSDRDVVSPYFTGAGVQWSAYPHADSDGSDWGLLMTEEKWDELYERVDYLKPRFMRVMDQANWRYFQGLDKNGRPVLDFENQETHALYKILDFCQERGIIVMIGEWGVPGHKHDIGDPSVYLDGVDDPRWYDMIGQWLDYLLNVKGYDCIRYYDIINEPNGSWSCVEGNFEEWCTAVRNLHAELVKRNLDDRIGICGPGSVPNADTKKYRDRWRGYEWLQLAGKEVGDMLTAYNTHAYYPHLAVRAGNAAEYMHFATDIPVAHDSGKPFFLGEIGLKAVKDGGEFAAEHERLRKLDEYASQDSNMYIYQYFYGLDMVSAAIQSFNAGVDAVAAWDVDDAMHTKNDCGDIHQLKKWGFWNILGTELMNDPAEEEIRPWYWAWSWLGRYLLPGSGILELPELSSEGCQVLVAKLPDGGYTVFSVNTSDKDADIRLVCRDDVAPVKMNGLVYNEKYAGNERPYEVSGETVADFAEGFRIDLPAKTLKVFTTLDL